MRAVPLVLALSLISVPVSAQQAGGYVVHLGGDTVAYERFVRTASRMEGQVIGKVPQVILRTWSIDFGPDGKPTRAEVIQTRPGETNPIQTTTLTIRADSAILETRRDTVRQRRAFSRAGVPDVPLPVPAGPGQSWAITDIIAERLRASQDNDSVHVIGNFVGATNTMWISWTRVGRDSVRIRDSNNGQWRGRLGANGRLEDVAPVSGTQQFTAHRINAPDVPAIATAWRAREQQTSSAGILSPRDTVRASVGGATLLVDYGRPSKRGRTVYGSTIVPWGQVWRTGANAATQFRTDRALEMGGVVVPAGFYTLWTVPSESGWRLLINSQTGQWGTAHDPTRDVFALPMTTTSLSAPVERFTITVSPQGQGGVINLDWDTTRASIPFTVR